MNGDDDSQDSMQDEEDEEGNWSTFNDYHTPSTLTNGQAANAVPANYVKKMKNIFKLMSRHARLINPKEFRLPDDMVYECAFINPRKEAYLDKDFYKTIASNTDTSYNIKPIAAGEESQPRLIITVDASKSSEGTPSAPSVEISTKDAQTTSKGRAMPYSFLKICYNCQKGCQTAPLIRCDICPLAFHPDCLNPPMSALPNTSVAWICPVHSPEILEQKLLTSADSLSQRIKLWDYYANLPISDDVIKMEFLKKLKTTNIPNSTTNDSLPPPAPMPKVHVPSSIKEAYRNRPDLLPKFDFDVRPTFLERGKQTETNREQLKEDEVEERKVEEDDEPEIKPDVCLENNIQDEKMEIDRTKDDSKETTTSSDDKIIANNIDDDNVTSCLRIGSDDTFTNCDSVETLSCDSDNELFFFDSKPTTSKKGKKLSGKGKPLSALNYLGDDMIRLLAYMKLQDMQFDPKSLRDIDPTLELPKNLKSDYHHGGKFGSKAVVTFLTEECYTETKPLTCSRFSRPMLYNLFKIGTSPECDLVLTDFGRCNYHTPVHAEIYYDQVSVH